jgi:hypothetical protein
VAAGGSLIQSHTHNPKPAAIMTRQAPSLPINDLSQQQLSTNQNPPNNQYHVHQSFQSLLTRVAKESAHPFTAADNNITPLPIINSPLIPTSDLSIITAKPVTEIHKTTLFPNQTFTFNSQPTINSLSANNLVQENNPNRPTLKQISTRILPDLAIDPKSTRPKKPKNNPTKPNPTHNRTETESTQKEQEDMEIQSDKKRRREELKFTSAITSEVSEHFLTAGPGSQACRDQ